jgi:hypothetical protein
VTRFAIAAAALLLGGCLDSLLGAPCRAGFVAVDGRCVADPGAQPDAGVVGVGSDALAPDAVAQASDAGSDAPACTAVLDDPMNCGACGHVCASGICTGTTCSGEVPGHVVAIGHDFTTTNAGVLRVLGNAAAMGQQHDLAIARWGTSPVVSQGLATSLGQLGRPWHAVAIPAQPSQNALSAADVVVVDPRVGDGDARELEGTSWRDAFAAFTGRGGVVIVLECENGTNFRFAHGAGLFSSGAPTTVTGSHLTVTAPTDAVVQQVPSPYYAASTTVAFPGLPAVVATSAGDTVVFHAAVP